MTDYTELKQLAEAATPGPWTAAGPSFGSSDQPMYLEEVLVDRAGDEDDTYTVCQAPDGLRSESSADMVFIAAANPAAILALIAENERLRVGMKGDYYLDAWLDWAKEAEALRKDAKRYRWLRNTQSWGDAEGQAEMAADIWIVESYEKVFNRSGEQLDTSIDYFMNKEQTE